MKSTIMLISCLFSIAVHAEAGYQAPSQLDANEANNVTLSKAQSSDHLRNHWQNRLALANAQKQKMASTGTPLARPYYGDFAGQTASHHH